MAVTTGNCGDKYRHLAVTVNGDSMDNPYGRVPEKNDYTAWKERAREIGLMMRDHIHKLYDADRTAYFAMQSDHNAVIDSYAKLPEESFWWLYSDRTENIAAVISVIADELCMMERYDNAIAAAGGTPPPVPGGIKPDPKPKPIADIIPDAINKTTDAAIKLGAVALGAYLIINLTKKK